MLRCQTWRGASFSKSSFTPGSCLAAPKYLHAQMFSQSCRQQAWMECRSSEVTHKMTQEPMVVTATKALETTSAQLLHCSSNNMHFCIMISLI